MAIGNGFTLIELLVVIGIIAVLAGILLVAVSAIGKAGGTTKSKADLQALANALEQYKNDFGAYPRVDAPNTGAAVLAKALLGPSPKPKTTGPYLAGEVFIETVAPPQTPRTWVALLDDTNNPPTSPNPSSEWASFNPFDGADGPAPDYREAGFRVGQKVIDVDPNVPGSGRPGGRVYGPYVQAEKFRVAKDSLFFTDANGKPILYFPAASSKPDLTIPQRTSPTPSNGGYVAEGPGGLFNAQDNIRFFMRKNPLGTDTVTLTGVQRIRAMMGDYGLDGGLNKQTNLETDPGGAEGLPFVLWSAGPDGNFGPNIVTDSNPKDPLNLNPATAEQWKSNANAVQKTDDITNFR